ncbi:hypothetical protein ACA910_004689 [Epithemia clementina (nom. ined.)]
MNATMVTVTVGEDRPKRPLSAYNIFFRDARQKLLANRPVRPEGVPRRSHGKMGFAEMAQTISRQWNTLHPTLKEPYEQMGRQERALYKRKLTAWKYVTGQTTRKLHKKKPKMSKRTSVVQKSNNSNSNPSIVQQRILPTATTASTTTTENPQAMMNTNTCNYRTAGEVGVSAATVWPPMATAAMGTTLDQNDPLLMYEDAQHEQLLSSIMGVHNSAPTTTSINQIMGRPQPQFPEYVAGKGADAANNNTLNHFTMTMIMEQAKLIQEINILLSDMGPAGLQQAAMPQPALAVACAATATATPMDPMTSSEVPEQSRQMLPQQDMAPLTQVPQSQQQPFVVTMGDCDIEPYECGAVPQQDDPMELFIMAQQFLPLLNNENNHQDNNNDLDMDESGLISGDLLDNIFDDDES